VGGDIEGFEYNPKEEYRADSIVYNMPDESKCILKFFSLIHEIKPNIITSFNGDRFDWPYIDKRCELLNINME
jgi:DNA polymerase epsilon subunit 1